jgi:hypothetical protein
VKRHVVLALLVAVLAVPVLLLYSNVVPVDVLCRAVSAWLWLAVWTLACLGAGAPVVSMIAPGDVISRRADVILACGAAFLAFIAAILAWTGLLRGWALVLLLLLCVGNAVRLLVVKGLRPALPEIAVGLAPGVLLCAMAAAVSLILTTPPVMYDSLNYHLAFPASWLDAGGFVEQPRHAFSYYPAAQGLLYTFALASVGPWGAVALHWWMGALATLCAVSLAHRLGGPKAAVWAAACFALTPSVIEISAYAIADLAVAAFAGASLVVLVEADFGGRQAWRYATLVGLLAGAAAASKYLALATVLVPVGLAGLAAGLASASRGERRKLLIPGAAAAGACVVVLLPWLVRNLIWTGNPLYPYLRDLLGGPPCGMSVAAELVQNDITSGSWLVRLGSIVGALVVRTFRPIQVGGVIGPHWLLLLPAAALLPRQQGLYRRLLWVATVSGALTWGSLVQFGRFLVPSLVAAAALAGTAAHALTTLPSRATRAVMWLLLMTILLWNCSTFPTRPVLQRLEVAAGVLPDRDYLATWISYAPLLSTISEQLPEDAHILLVSEARSFYIERKVTVEDPYRAPWLLELAQSCHSPAELAASLSKHGITHFLVNEGEMDRYAALRNVDRYWAGASPDTMRIIQGLFTDYVDVLARHRQTWLGALRTESKEAEAGGTADTALALTRTTTQQAAP